MRERRIFQRRIFLLVNKSSPLAQFSIDYEEIDDDDDDEEEEEAEEQENTNIQPDQSK